MSSKQPTGLFLVYSSSAGSGKTYTLVKHYLKLTIKNPDNYRNVLAITFTKKASAEMKERVIKSLYILSKEETSAFTEKEISSKRNYQAFLSEETGLTTDQIRINADILLKNILHGYGEFSITTIDSFIHRVIRSFSFDLYLPFNFEIETDYKAIIQQAVQLLLNRIGQDREITNILIDYIQNKVDDQESWKISDKLQADAKELEKEMSARIVESLDKLDIESFLDIIRKARTEVNKFEAALKSMGEKALAIIKGQGLSDQDFYQGKKGIYGLFLKASLGNGLDIDPEGSNIRKSLEEGKWASSKAKGAVHESVMQISHGLMQIGRDIISYLEDRGKEIRFIQLSLKRMYSVALLNELKKCIEEIKEENGIIAIADFNKIISDIILEQPVPFIFERTAGRFNHVLIDEFQDTSVLQWENLMSLVENSLSQNNFSMVVGDAKQAIYRFRGGESRQLMEIDKPRPGQDNPFVLDRLRILSHHLKRESLTVNYRSDKVIVDFNNKFFSHFFKTETNRLGQTYQDVIQQPKSDKDEGYVEIRMIGGDGNAKQKESRAQLLENVFQTVQSCIDQGFKYEDIAILVRSNKLGSQVARCFLENETQVPVVSPDSISLGYDPKVNFLFEFLKVLVNSQDFPAHISVLNYIGLIFNDLNDEVEKLIHQIGDMLNPDEGQYANPKGISVLFWDWMRLKFGVSIGTFLSLPLFELAESLVRTFKLVKTPDPFLIGFLDAVNEFVSGKYGGISEFVEWWDVHRFEKSVVLPEGFNAVNIMTIHKSKGLQFPIVILLSDGLDIKKSASQNIWIENPDEIPSLPYSLVGFEKDLNKTKHDDEFNEELLNVTEDLWNLIYVSFTRPENQLYIFAHPVNSEDKKSDIKTKPSLDLFLDDYLIKANLKTNDSKLYSFGNKHVSMQIGNEEVEEKSGQMFDEMLSEDWTSRLKVSIPGIEDINMNEYERMEGTLVHQLFSRCNSNKDIQEYVVGPLKELAQKNNDFTHISLLADNISRMLASGVLGRFYSPGLESYNEIDILSDSGEIYRPDRIVYLDEFVWVVEFKTGNTNADHILQVKKYSEILGNMVNKAVRGAIFYFSQDKVVEV